MTDPGKPEWLPGAAAVAKRRLDNNGMDSPMAQCLPSATTRLGPAIHIGADQTVDDHHLG